MNRQAIIDAVNGLSKDNVISVYAGKPGCCCGCRGNHYHSSRFVEIEVYEHTVFNDGQVTRVINVLKKKLDCPEEFSGFDVQDQYVAHQTDTRLLIAYVKL